MHYVNRGACRGCALKAQCTSNSYRRIGRYADEAVLDRMAERLADRPGVLHRRRESAEHPFGSIKHWMGHGGFLVRRLENVRGEFSLTALAYNIRRATTLVGIPELIAAWGVQTSWNRPPKGLFQRIRAHGISESTTIHSRPKSQVLLTPQIRLGPTFHTVLFLYAMSLTQRNRGAGDRLESSNCSLAIICGKELLHHSGKS